MDYQFKAGTIALLVSMPHAGTDIPDDLAARMTSGALELADTDWHLRELYGFLGEMGASVISARWSRYVIDLNRPADDTNLYPGLSTTGLCPVDTFRSELIYLDGNGPDAEQVQARLRLYWAPYHRQLRAELDRMLAIHPRVALWDAHSIASRMPRFFEGRLPDLNFGTAQGTSCDAGMQDAVINVASAQDRFSVAVNGRFKGGHITRHYGQPHNNVHAIQLEMCQCLYMDEQAPFAYRPELAAQVQPLLGKLAGAAVEWLRA
jgi:N-formylglutamate deformylase